MVIESKVTRIYQGVPTEACIKAVEKGEKELGISHAQIAIEYWTDIKEVHFVARSLFTRFAIDEVLVEKLGHTCYKLFDHSETLYGYYKTKEDYLALVDEIKANGHTESLIAYEFGGSRNCALWLNALLIEEIIISN